MGPYFLLTTRKRALIALVHSVAFLLLALVARPAASVPMALAYTAVTAVLAGIALWSRHGAERLYFSLCAASAGVGLARVAMSVPAMGVAVAVRAGTLAAAIVVVALIFRSHSR